MQLRDQLNTKYRGYLASGKRLFAVTLSTYAKSQAFMKREGLHMWNEHFLYRVNDVLTYKLKNKFDHDFVIENCKKKFGSEFLPELSDFDTVNYHFHGLLAFPEQAASKIWKDGALNKQLCRDLDSFKLAGGYRPFKINKHLIEPIKGGEVGIEKWVRYITKTPDFIAPTYA